jgi:hypothetical protein
VARDLGLPKTQVYFRVPGLRKSLIWQIQMALYSAHSTPVDIGVFAEKEVIQ